jgi:hypothetical protein
LAESPLQVELKRDLEISMRKILQNPKLEDALVPEWGVGYCRLCPDTGYLEVNKYATLLFVLDTRD